jgi:DNA-binding response OmpR family regulator
VACELVSFLLNPKVIMAQTYTRTPPLKGRDLILVVEDDADARELIGAVLLQAGYAVEVAEDGFDALRKASRMRPDLVLSDLQMPGMHGVELIQHLRRLHADVPVILATGVPETKDLQTDADLYGAVAVMAKPVNLDELLWTIDSALACHRNAGQQDAASSAYAG